MSVTINPIPKGYESPIPYLKIDKADGATAAIDFYKAAFGATELLRMAGPDGRIGHAELRIGGGIVMLADEHPEINAWGPKHYGGSPVGLMVYVEDVDALAARATEAGARVLRPLADQFYGDRTVGLEDPFGYDWYFATHVEDVSGEEMARRHEEASTKAAST